MYPSFLPSFLGSFCFISINCRRFSAIVNHFFFLFPLRVSSVGWKFQ
jgi:hypothetical protein